MTPQQLKEARRKLGLSVSQMGTMLDTAASTIRKMETDASRSTHRKPAPRMQRLIDAYLSGYRPDDWPSPQK
jgi:DNA-binding transcriptional regulator YiaG